MTTFIKPLVFEQSNIQAQQFIPSFFLPPLTHDIDTLRTLISLIKSPPLLPCLQLLCIKLALTTDFKQYFPVLVKNATNKMQNLTFNLKLLTNNMKNWLVSDKNQWVSQRIPKVQKNNEKYFIKNHWKIWPSYSHLRNSIYCSPHYQYNKVTDAVGILLTNNMKNWLVSDNNQWVSQRIPKSTKNNEKYFIKNHWKIWPSYSHLRNSIYCSPHYQYNKVTDAVGRRSKRNIKIFLLEKIENKVITLTPDNPYSDNHFET